MWNHLRWIWWDTLKVALLHLVQALHQQWESFCNKSESQFSIKCANRPFEWLVASHPETAAHWEDFAHCWEQLFFSPLGTSHVGRWLPRPTMEKHILTRLPTYFFLIQQKSSKISSLSISDISTSLSSLGISTLLSTPECSTSQYFRDQYIGMRKAIDHLLVSKRVTIKIQQNCVFTADGKALLFKTR